MAIERSRSTRRMPRRGVSVLLASVLAAVALAGCTPPEPPATSPTPTPTSIFASEEEALAAATDVYQQYNAALDKESAQGDVSLESLRPMVTPEYFEKLEAPSLIKKNGWHTSGVTTFDEVSIVDESQSGQIARVRIRLCRDVSAVKILDVEGVDVTPATRAERFPVEIELVSSAPLSSDLLISNSGSWSGDDFC